MKRCAVIMAGGSGTRLWPLSRRGRPKQLLHILDGSSLLRRAFERLAGLAPPEETYVIALAEHLPAIAEELPELPRANLIGEPTGRDTANAVALAASILHHRHGEVLMAVFTADHVIQPVERFAAVVEAGYRAVEADADALVTFGIKPTEPHTGMGYVERGEPVLRHGETLPDLNANSAGGQKQPGVWNVRRFKEKPDAETARRYLADGGYYWNSGMFVWRTTAILEQLAARLPESHDAAGRLAAVWDTDEGRREAARVYPALAKVSIDYAVMEQAPRVLVVEMDVQWHDVGSWTALPAVLPADAAGNVAAAERVAILDARNNILVAEDGHLLAAVGVEDLIIVHSENATLVCHRRDAQRIKELVERLAAEHGQAYQ